VESVFINRLSGPGFGCPCAAISRCEHIENIFGRGRPAALSALTYVEGLQRYCLGLADVPERGTRRAAIRPGLRTLDYRRRVTVAFQLTGTPAIILRLPTAAATSRGCCGRTMMMADVADGITAADPVQPVGTIAAAAHFRYSTLPERLVEHVFVGDALRALWRQGIVDVEVLPSEFDVHGYDLVMGRGRTVRHIQFKTGTSKKPGHASMSQSFAEKPSGCVICIRRRPILVWDRSSGSAGCRVSRYRRSPEAAACDAQQGRRAPFAAPPSGGAGYQVPRARDANRGAGSARRRTPSGSARRMS
jgi:plasmid stabilization system protein ParE